MTHVTDDVMVDIIWIHNMRMPRFNTRLGKLKKEKYTYYICSIYLIYIYIYISNMYIIFLIYCIYMEGEKCVLYK